MQAKLKQIMQEVRGNYIPIIVSIGISYVLLLEQKKQIWRSIRRRPTKKYVNKVVYRKR